MLFDFIGRGGRELASNPRAGKIASELVKVERDFEPLFTAHRPVSFDL